MQLKDPMQKVMEIMAIIFWLIILYVIAAIAFRLIRFIIGF